MNHFFKNYFTLVNRKKAFSGNFHINKTMNAVRIYIDL
jgi:hypothetical protein